MWEQIRVPPVPPFTHPLGDSGYAVDDLDLAYSGTDHVWLKGVLGQGVSEESRKHEGSAAHHEVVYRAKFLFLINLADAGTAKGR